MSKTAKEGRREGRAEIRGKVRNERERNKSLNMFTFKKMESDHFPTKASKITWRAL